MKPPAFSSPVAFSPSPSTTARTSRGWPYWRACLKLASTWKPPTRFAATKQGKGEAGTFGSQLIEYDIIHVCRKRTEEPRSQLGTTAAADHARRAAASGHPRTAPEGRSARGRPPGDPAWQGSGILLQALRQGVRRKRAGREFTVKDALVGINQLLDDESDTTNEAPPVLAEPYTRQFLRLFADSTSLARDQMQKFLRGTGVSPKEFLERGWCSEARRSSTHATRRTRAKWKGQPRNGMARDFDQAMFLVGACYENSGILCRTP